MPRARVRGCLDACRFTTAKNCYSGPNEQLLCLAHDYLPIADISARHQLVRRPARRRSLRSVGLKQFAPGEPLRPAQSRCSFRCAMRASHRRLRASRSPNELPRRLRGPKPIVWRMSGKRSARWEIQAKIRKRTAIASQVEACAGQAGSWTLI